MISEKADPLWPVALLIVGVVSGTSILEAQARNYSASAHTIVVPGAAPTIAPNDDEESEGDEGDEGGTDREGLEPVSDEHRRIQRLARRGDLVQALAAFGALVEAFPNSASAHADYGYWLIRGKRLDEAVRELTRALELKPESALLHMNLGAAYRKQGKAEEAIVLYRKALRLRPGYIEAELALARALVLLKRPDEAKTLLKKAAEHGDHESRARALVALGRIQLDTAESDQATKSFTRAIEWLPASADVRAAIARAWFNTKKAKGRAQQTLEAALAADRLAPGDARILSLIGKTYELLKDVESARNAYLQTIEADPTQVYAIRRLFRFELDARNFVAAERYARALLNQDDSKPRHHFLLGLVLARSGSVDAARRSYLRAIDVAQGTYPEAYFNLALLEKNEKNLPEAISMYQKAIEQKPDYVQAYNNLGVAQINANDLEGARSSYEKALSIDPSYVSAWINLGELHAKSGNFQEAVRCMETASARRPQDLDLALSFSHILTLAGDTKRAREILDHLVSVDPRSATAWVERARATLALGDLAEARRSAERSLELSHSPEALRLLADVARQEGKLDDARTRYLDLLEQTPRDTSVRLLLAQVFYDQGELKACTRELKKILRFGGDLSKTKEWLTRCDSP